MKPNINTLKLCLVTQMNGRSFAAYRPLLLKAIQGGVTAVQLREKIDDLHTLKQLAMELKKLLRQFDIPLIINDYPDIACEVDAEGVHLGQSDMSPAAAREILGPDKIIGLSVESIAEVIAANKLDSVDYLAASAVFPSRSKPDCQTLWGIDGLARVAELSKFPVIAIGGITAENAGEVVRHGAQGIAVIGAIHRACSPAHAAKALSVQFDLACAERRAPCFRR